MGNKNIVTKYKLDELNETELYSFFQITAKYCHFNSTFAPACRKDVTKICNNLEERYSKKVVKKVKIALLETVADVKKTFSKGLLEYKQMHRLSFQ